MTIGRGLKTFYMRSPPKKILEQDGQLNRFFCALKQFVCEIEVLAVISWYLHLDV